MLHDWDVVNDGDVDWFGYEDGVMVSSFLLVLFLHALGKTLEKTSFGDNGQRAKKDEDEPLEGKGGYSR